ncbi:MAG: hypothetical protein JJT75_11665 [Opitutales bacterium]|nr:hypothetical protein [Opitutales bacterium]MCH8540008.1 hypothetical protein [Opitutales bacterium]
MLAETMDDLVQKPEEEMVSLRWLGKWDPRVATELHKKFIEGIPAGDSSMVLWTWWKFFGWLLVDSSSDQC